jgi:UDP-N-acetylmuramoylalanine--D-glutamate ligase
MCASSELVTISVPWPWARNWRSTDRAMFAVPSRSVVITRSNTWAGTSSKRPYAITAAESAQTSIRPNRSTAASTSSSTSWLCVTSVGTTSGSPPHAAATDSRSARPRAASTSRSPRAAKASAAALPIPLDAPVSTTTREVMVQCCTPGRADHSPARPRVLCRRNVTVSRVPGRIVRLQDLRGRRVAVWGTGREGIAAAEAIAPVGPARLIAVQDRATFAATTWTGRLAEIAPLHTGEDAHRELQSVDVIVRSPVIAQVHPWIVEFRARGGRVTGGTALWMADHAARTIGVTGSKGKSTTTTLIHHLLTATGRPATLGGNIGVAALSLPESDRYVLELSVYQCADLDDSPRVVALTSLFPEHLDWTGSEERYYRDKLNVAMHGAGTIVYNGRDERLESELRRGGADLPLVAAGRPEGFHVAPGPDGERWFCYADEPLFPRSAMPLAGRHNEGNLCVALGAVQAAGVSCVAERAALAAALGTYQALDHRMTPIADPSGLTFVDDSLSTIPQSAVHAIEAYAGRPLTVIVGGEDRGVDYTPLRDYLVSAEVEATLIGIPDSGPRILDAVAGVAGITTMSAGDLVEAVRLGREHTAAGGVVLMSPAAPSYGRFDNFEHRSRVFRAAIASTLPA